MLLPVTLTGSVPAGLMGTAYIAGPLGSVIDVPRPDLGVTGTLPQDSRISTELLRGEPADPTVGTGAGLAEGRLGIPGVVLQAYLRAQEVLASEQPGCHLPWWLLAGIGKVESGHAWNGLVDADGNTLRPILGPVLNGAGGFAAIPDTDGGRWDGDPVWDRAVGPMQFIPSTWSSWGRGNPNNVYDAAQAAGRYLCAGGRDLSDSAQLAAAVFSYNHSNSYVQKVLSWARAYASGGVVPVPGTTTLPAGGAPPPRSGTLDPSRPGGSGRDVGKNPGGDPGRDPSTPDPDPTTPDPDPTTPDPDPTTPDPDPTTPDPDPTSPDPDPTSPDPDPTTPDPDPTPTPTPTPGPSGSETDPNASG